MITPIKLELNCPFFKNIATDELLGARVRITAENKCARVYHFGSEAEKFDKTTAWRNGQLL